MPIDVINESVKLVQTAISISVTTRVTAGVSASTVWGK